MDSMELKVLSHPLRVRILGALTACPSTAVQVAKGLGQPISKVVYHTAILCDADYVRPVEGGDPDAADPVYEAGHP